MKSILLMGNNQAEKLTAQQLQKNFNVIEINTGYFTKEITYQKLPQDLTMVISFIGPLDVDLAMEALFESLHQQKIKLKRMIMVSTAGIDNEVAGQLDYPGVSDVVEYLREQRYAIKIIDEEEIPYTIFRPVNVVKEKVGRPQAINEGNQVPVGNVSYETITDFIVAAILKDQYHNQSIALIETK